MAQVLYTPEVLSLAIELARFPLGDDLHLRGHARSTSCGSTIELGLALDDAGRVTGVGLRSQACAIGQASAAIFARGVPGSSVHHIRETAGAMAAWLRGDGPIPDWPGMDAIAVAQGYPARHGAVMLPWNAAKEALPSA